MTLRIGFVEPHLFTYGGIRRMIELANGLVDRGHWVSFYLPDYERSACSWMECRARVAHVSDGLDEPLDVLMFNEETQVQVPFLFRAARRLVFFALHDGGLYGKPGSWTAARAPVHLQLANSTWTRDRIALECGNRPTVVLGGVNPEHFRPLDVPKRYPLLTVGDEREWKGAEVVRQAARIVGLPLEEYSGKHLPQTSMAEEYSSAEIFVVGSDVEGFGQPGIEALACGIPLVTTDNGGCRDYARHGETALVVPPRDPTAMAQAITSLRNDPELAAKLREAGLRLVKEHFSWPAAAAQLEQVLMEVVSNVDCQPLDLHPKPPEAPVLTIVVLAWDQLELTQRCVESIRRHTDVPYELVIVDNGSAPEAAEFARLSADYSILNAENLGFAVGMNQGLRVARGQAVAFVNNDTEFPHAWASRLMETVRRHDRAGIVVPAVTAAGNQRTVRSEPGSSVEVIPPFEAPPSAVVYVMPRDVAADLEGWGEEFPVASAEDVDLCFKVWTNGLDIVFDSRVLVDHVSKGTAGVKLDDWRALWAANRQILLDKWTDPDAHVPRLDRCLPDEFERNRLIARSVAGWMRSYFAVTDRGPVANWLIRRALPIARPLVARLGGVFYRRRDDPRIKPIADRIRRDPRLRRLWTRVR